jgi:phage gpG-like protein
MEVDISDVTRGLNLMHLKAADLRPVFKDLRAVLKEEIAEHFEKNEGPEGPWEPRSRAYVEKMTAKPRARSGWSKKKGRMVFGTTRRRRKGSKWESRQLGRFRSVGAYQFHVEPQQLTMNAKGPWAGIHQFGGTAGKGANIPARPFLWVSDRFVDTFRRSLERHVLSGWVK